MFIALDSCKLVIILAVPKCRNIILNLNMSYLSMLTKKENNKVLLKLCPKQMIE